MSDWVGTGTIIATPVGIHSGGQGWTRAEMREEVAQTFGLIESIATATPATSLAEIIDTKASRYSDDYFKGWSVYLKTCGAHAAPEGEESTVVGFVASTGTFTVSPAFTAMTASGDTYQLYRYVTKTAIDNALANSAAGGQQKNILTASISTLDYDLSGVSGLRDENQIESVWVRRFGQVIRSPFQVQDYQIEDAGGMLTLRLPYRLNPSDQLWVIWTVGENFISADADRINIPFNLIFCRTMVELLGNMLFAQDESGMNKWGLLLREYKDRLTKAERAYQLPAGRVRRHVWEGDESVDNARIALGLVRSF
jgi:hypothetical protein